MKYVWQTDVRHMQQGGRGRKEGKAKKYKDQRIKERVVDFIGRIAEHVH